MLNFNQLRNQIQDNQQPQSSVQQANSLKLKIGLTYKLEHAQNRLLIETEISEINDLRGLENLNAPTYENEGTGEFPVDAVMEPGIQVKIKEKATKVLEALAYEFKLFKELTSVPDPNLWKLIAYHSRMERTFEVTNLTQ